MKLKDIQPGVEYFYSASNKWAEYTHHTDGKIVLAEEGRWVQPWSDGWSSKPKPAPRPATDRDGNDWGILVWHVNREGRRTKQVAKPSHVRGPYAECIATRQANDQARRAQWDAEDAAHEQRKAVAQAMTAIGIADARLERGKILITVEQATAITAALSAINWTFQG